MQKTILDLLITASLFLFVTVLGVVALGFMVAGVYLLLAAHLPSWSAALLTGAALLALAILVLLVFRLATRSGRANEGAARSRARAQRAEDGSDDEAAARARNAQALELALELAGKSGLNARDATLIALIAGTLVGVSPELRRQIMALFTSSGDD